MYFFPLHHDVYVLTQSTNYVSENKTPWMIQMICTFNSITNSPNRHGKSVEHLVSFSHSVTISFMWELSQTICPLIDIQLHIYPNWNSLSYIETILIFDCRLTLKHVTQFVHIYFLFFFFWLMSRRIDQNDKVNNKIAIIPIVIDTIRPIRSSYQTSMLNVNVEFRVYKTGDITK